MIDSWYKMNWDRKIELELMLSTMASYRQMMLVARRDSKDRGLTKAYRDAAKERQIRYARLYWDLFRRYEEEIDNE